MQRSFRNRSIFKYLPSFMVNNLIREIVGRHYAGFAASDYLLYYPRGLNADGDRVIAEFEAKGVTVLRRHDVSFLPVAGARHSPGEGDSKEFFLLSPVLFRFKTFPEGNLGYNKGNDRIIQGVAKFARRGIPFKLHLFEKGPDVEAARQLIKECHLERYVVWHQEMPLSELLALYAKAHVVFDQVGDHWIGAVGVYALYLGIPLIASARNLVAAGVIPERHPILDASNAEEVCQRLIELTQAKQDKAASLERQAFALKHFGPERIVACLENMASS